MSSRIGRLIEGIGRLIRLGRMDVPTTKLLAMGSFTAQGTPDKWKPLLSAEVPATFRLYLARKIDQW